MISSTVPNKRTRLSELEQPQNQQQSQQNLQQFTNQNTQLRQVFNQSPNQHQHQLITGEFIQSPHMQQQQQQQQTSPQAEPLLTSQDIQLLQKGFDFLVETVIPNKSQQAKEVFANVINSSITNNTTTQKNDSNLIALDIPILNESAHNESETITSPLRQLLSHIYPSSIVELVEKFSKVSVNPLDLNSTLSNTNNNPTNNVSSPSVGTPSSKTTAPPTKELCQHLIQEYFTQFNATFPILDRRKFIDHWRNNTKQSQLLVTATLALAAARYSDDPSIQKTSDKPGGIFFDGAKKLLDTMYDTPRLETVQALLLLANSEITLSRANSGLMFLGMAVRMAHMLGLERSDSSNLLPEEIEERRRVFYCVYCCDRWISFMLGKPHSIDDININAPLPSLPSLERPARNFFLAFVKLSRIIGQIWRFGYSSQPKAAQSTWTDHVMDQKSMLRQIRAALAKWLKELPDELQYQYLPNTDIKSLNFQLARFSVYAGYINIMFHTCIILLHQPYLSQAYDNPKIEANQGPIKTCLTAATTITDIAKTTRHFDKKAFGNFHYPFYGIFQSVIMEMVIMNGSADHAQDSKKALNDTVEELRWVAENTNFGHLKEVVKELESIIMITSGTTGNHLSIPLPLVIQMLEQSSSNNLQNTQKSSSTTNNDNPISNNTSITSKYSDDNFMSDSTRPEYNGDNLTTISSNNTEPNSPITARQNLTSTTTIKSSNTSNLQNQPQNMFLMSPTSSPLFSTQDHTSSTAATSLNQQFSSSFDANNHNNNRHQNAHEIPLQSGNPQWEPFYMDELLFDNTNTDVSASHNQVMDDLSSIYSGFNTYSHDGSQ